jgi:hypothetical protein
MTVRRLADGESLTMQRIIWGGHLFSPPVILSLPNAGHELRLEAGAT